MKNEKTKLGKITKKGCLISKCVVARFCPISESAVEHALLASRHIATQNTALREHRICKYKDELDFKNAFEKVDVIAGPTTPSPAFELGAKMDDPIEMYLNDIFTIGANLGGFPAMSVPCGFVNDLPVGLQLVGKHFGEESLFQCGHQFQQLTDWHKQTPEQFK